MTDDPRTAIHDSDGELVGHLAMEPESRFVKHERSLTMAVVVVIPVLLVLGLMWRESKARIDDIQKSRAEITYVGCLEQNARHDNTVRRLDDVLIARKGEVRKAIKAATSPAEAAALRAQIDALDDGRATTVSLIDALAPFVGCEQLVLDRFGYIPNVNGEEG